MNKLQDVHTMEYCTALKKKKNPVLCDNIDEPSGHHVKSNKPIIKGQILYHSTYMSYLKQANSDTESRMVTRGWREGAKESCLKGIKFQLYKMKASEDVLQQCKYI